MYMFILNEGIVFYDGILFMFVDVVLFYEIVCMDLIVQGNVEFVLVFLIMVFDVIMVEIVLLELNQNFLFVLIGLVGFVFKQGDMIDFKIVENGMGFFMLMCWNKGSSIVFVCNDVYWGEKVGVVQVEFQYILDFMVGVNVVFVGDVDVFMVVDFNFVLQLEDFGDFMFMIGCMIDKVMLVFNNKKVLFDDVCVWEVLCFVIDYEVFIDVVGVGMLMYGLILEFDFGYEDLLDVIFYDLEKVKELLVEVGQEDLELMFMIFLFYGMIVLKVLILDFKKVGVIFEVDVVEFLMWLEDVYMNYDYDFSFVLYVEFCDFGNFVNLDYYFGYDNLKVQDLYVQVLVEVDVDVLVEFFVQVVCFVFEDYVVDWLYNGEIFIVVSLIVVGFFEDLINLCIDLVGVIVFVEN